MLKLLDKKMVGDKLLVEFEHPDGKGKSLMVHITPELQSFYVRNKKTGKRSLVKISQ